MEEAAIEIELNSESYRLSQQLDVHGSYHIEVEIYNACVQSSSSSSIEHL